MTGKNKYLSYQILKHGQKFLNNIAKTPKKKNSYFFQEKSRIALLKQISRKIIKEKINQKIDLTNKLIDRRNSNYKIRNIIKIKPNLKIEENKNCSGSIYIQSNFINKNKSVKYYEMSKKGCNLSDALIVEKQHYPNSRKKKKKIGRKISAKFLTFFKRPLSSLEKYYIKFGVIP